MIKNRGAVELSINKVGKDKFGQPGWGQPIKCSHKVAVVQSVTFHEMYGGGAKWLMLNSICPVGFVFPV